MIIDPPIKSLIEKVDCRYSPVVVAAKRARQIVNGSEPLIKMPADEKPVTVALREIENGNITYVRREDID